MDGQAKGCGNILLAEEDRPAATDAEELGLNSPSSPEQHLRVQNIRSDVVGARAECREGRGRGAIDTGYFARELMEVNGGTGIASRFFSSVR